MQSVFYFCDETAFKSGPVMAVGGIAIPSAHLARVVAELREIDEACHKGAEVKWHTTRPLNLHTRKAYVDYLVSLIDENKAHFHIRFAPSDEYDHDGPRRRFDTVSKMYYQLLLHRAVRFYGPHYDLHIHPDGGECTNQLEDHLGALDYEGQARYRAQASCIKCLECRDSMTEPLLQLLDVPLGALTAVRLGRLDDPDMSAAKRELAEHTIARFDQPQLRGNSPATEMKLSIWNAKPNRRENTAQRR